MRTTAAIGVPCGGIYLHSYLSDVKAAWDVDGC